MRTLDTLYRRNNVVNHHVTDLFSDENIPCQPDRTAPVAVRYGRREQQQRERKRETEMNIEQEGVKGLCLRWQLTIFLWFVSFAHLSMSWFPTAPERINVVEKNLLIASHCISGCQSIDTISKWNLCDSFGVVSYSIWRIDKKWSICWPFHM